MFELVPMTTEFAERVDGWRCDPPSDFYDLCADPDDREAFLDSDGWAHTRTVLEGDSLVGFFQFDPKPGAVEVGLGMAPAETGRGWAFVTAGLEYAEERYAPEQFVLCVAAFNERAIAVYERWGFDRVETFEQATDGGAYEFVRMARPAAVGSNSLP